MVVMAPAFSHFSPVLAQPGAGIASLSAHAHRIPLPGRWGRFDDGDSFVGPGEETPVADALPRERVASGVVPYFGSSPTDVLQPAPAVLPDFHFVPDERPLQYSGPFRRGAERYSDWLVESMSSAWCASGIKMAGLDMPPLIRFAANSLVRSNAARLERLIAWGVISAEDANAIETRSTDVSASRLMRMLTWLLAEHRGLGDVSNRTVRFAAKQLIPHFYLECLVRKYAEQGVTAADAWFFAVQHPADCEETLAMTLAETERLAEKYKDEGVTAADASSITPPTLQLRSRGPWRKPSGSRRSTRIGA